MANRLIDQRQHATQQADMIVHRATPLNAEPRPEVLGASFLTEQRDFYVRSHGDIPRLEAENYRLAVAGPAGQVEYGLRDLLARFPRRTVTCVLQCAGNRREDMLAVREVSGDPWQIGAIGNAEWAGVGLADVLTAAGVAQGTAGHVVFAAHDTIDEADGPAQYSVSIPLAKAMAPDTLLAFEMNGEALTAEHGFPVRVVVPGYAGVRSPKWLSSITVQDQPAGSHIQQREYKRFKPDETKETADYDAAPVINEMPVTSAILEPRAGTVLPEGEVLMRGYAVSAGMRITRVEVSADAGRTWQNAALEAHPAARWSWTFWSATVRLPPGEAELVVRAQDETGSDQPETTAEVWNFAGYLATAWHRVAITISARPAE